MKFRRFIVTGARALGANACKWLGEEGAEGVEHTLIHEIHDAESHRKAKACSQHNVHGDFSVWLENCNPIALKEEAKDARKYDQNREAYDKHTHGVDGLSRLRQDAK